MLDARTSAGALPRLPTGLPELGSFGRAVKSLFGPPEINRMSPQPGEGLPYSTSPAPALPLSGEAALISRAQTGDQVAFGELVELHQDFVYNLAFRILQDPAEADDATQEAFVKIWQALPTFRGESKFTTWAYRIVRNGCLNRLRSAKSSPRTVSVETSFDEGDEEERDLLARLPGDETDEPAWRFDTDERRRLIWREVDALPVKYREIIALYYGQELSYEEIAAALDVPVGTVKTHLYRAKGQLKSRLLELHRQGALDVGDRQA
jgi:RNA polymerase sigma-70 factor (ECF subfamily)